MTDRMLHQWLVDAALGAIAWIVVVATGRVMAQSGHAVIESLWLFAPLVVVPLGVRLSAREPVRGKHPACFVVATYLHPFASLAAVGAVLLEPGVPSAFLAGIWSAYCALLCAWGVLRFTTRRSLELAELAIDVGLAYVPIGGLWFVLSRLGQQPMDFGHDIVALTAVHFHYAGFAAPIVVGLAGRALARAGRPHALWRIGARAVIVCPIVVAAGILTSPLVEVVGAFALAIALTMSMVVVALRVGRDLPPLATTLLWTSALSLPATMILACGYALGEFTGARWLDVSHMAWIHGIANVFGFALAGLLAWTLAEPPTAEISARAAR